MVPARLHALQAGICVLGVLVQLVGLRLGQVDVHAADGVDAVLEHVEVHADVALHVQLEALAHRLHREGGAAVAEGVGDPVVVAAGHRHADAALDAHQLHGVLLRVQAQHHDRVGAGVVAEGVRPLVGPQQQDVHHVFILVDLAVGGVDLVGAVGQVREVQFVVVHRVHRAGVDLAAAVVVVQHIQLGDIVQRAGRYQQQKDRQNHRHRDQPFALFVCFRLHFPAFFLRRLLRQKFCL